MVKLKFSLCFLLYIPCIVISKDLQSIVQEQSLEIGAKQAGEKLNRTRRVLSMKTNQENKYE
jgi:hypothetical protein